MCMYQSQILQHVQSPTDKGRRPKFITSKDKNTHVAKQLVIVSNQQGMRPNLITSTDQKTHVSKQKAAVSSWPSMRPKLNTSTDQNTKTPKQEALVSSQQGKNPKLITSEGTQPPKLHVHQITKQLSTRSEGMFEVFTVQMQAETHVHLLERKYQCILGPSLSLTFSHFEGAYYLLIMDYRRRFPIVHKPSSMTGVHIANQYKLTFSEYGWPEILFTDNGPYYTSQAFTSVMKSYNV